MSAHMVAKKEIKEYLKDAKLNIKKQAKSEMI